MTSVTSADEPQPVWLIFQDNQSHDGGSPELLAVYATEEAARAAVAARPQDEQRDLLVDSEPVLTGQEP